MPISARSGIPKSDPDPPCVVCAEMRSRQIAAALCWRITHAVELNLQSRKLRREKASRNRAPATEKAGTLVFCALQTGAFHDEYRNVTCFAVGARRDNAEKWTFRAQHVPGNRVYILQGGFLCFADFLERNLFPRTQKSIDVGDPFSLITPYKHGRVIRPGELPENFAFRPFFLFFRWMCRIAQFVQLGVGLFKC